MDFLRRHTTLLKLLGIFLLALFLAIPLQLIDGLLDERAARRDTALAEIADTWGRSQTVTGPFLVVPYRAASSETQSSLVNGRLVQTTRENTAERLAVFLPESLVVSGDVTPVHRHRGIYQAVVYSAKLELSGRFAAPDVAALGIAPADLLWERAYLSLGVDDLRGARDALAVTWNGASHAFEPGTRHDLLPVGVHAPLPLSATSAAADFSIELQLNGSGLLAVTPVGRQTTVALRSPWPAPGFIGASLPEQREITAEGFTAEWRASYYGRAYPHQWTADTAQPARSALASSASGVELVTVIDTYRIVERATKYGLLFIALLFTAFFLFEILAALRLHVFHYTLVGAALVLFYLALLSLSEFIPFAAAYLCAAVASTLLIALYSVTILCGALRSLGVTAILGGIYGVLFFILQMQDYALLAGTAALFAVLGLVMFTTRKINWSATHDDAAKHPAR